VQKLLQWKKTVSITCSESVFAALGIQHAMRMRHIVISGLLSFTFLFYIISKQHDFRKKKVIAHKMCVLIFSTTLF
jgi:hypothetical protein